MAHKSQGIINMFVKAIKRIAAISVAAAVLSGCAIGMKVPVKDPVLSSPSFAASPAPAPISLTFKDEQSGVDKSKPLTGTLPMAMMYQDKPFEPISWISQQTVREMKARGLPVSISASGGTTVVIKRMHIENYRANGFSPFITFTTLSADVETPQGTQRIVAYVKRGKVPVWSFDEVIDPTYNDALAVISKEFAAKLNQILFGQVVSDDKVRSMIANIEKDNGSRGDLFMDVYQLGFSNNPIVVPELVKLTSHPNEYVRLAALSSLGILRAEDQLGFLESRYASGGLWQDRAMALKAIGDIGTPEARAYLEQQKSKFDAGTDKEARWTEDVVALYLESSGHRMRPVKAGESAVAATNANAQQSALLESAISAPVSTPAPAPLPKVAPPVPVPVAAAPVIVTKAAPAPAPALAVQPVAVPAPPAVVPPVAAAVPAATVTMQSVQPGYSEYSQYANIDVPFKIGESSNTVEDLAKASGCTSTKGAGWVAGKTTVQYYREACIDGRVFVARCEFRQCAEIQR